MTPVSDRAEVIAAESDIAAKDLLATYGVPTTETLALNMLKIAWCNGRLNGLAWERQNGA